MRFLLTVAGAALLTGPAAAADLELDLEVPRLNVAEYHRPYVAVWVAHPDHTVAANLAVWYQQDDGPEGKGETWLKDIRQWWRRIGRTLDMPVDGVSGPTQAPGAHTLTFSGDAGPLSALEPGDYTLQIEAAREVGGRELVSIPFSWPPQKEHAQTLSGESELGNITLRLLPD